MTGRCEELALALEEFALIDECEGGNPMVIAYEREAAALLRTQLAEMSAAAGYLMNAKFDLESGSTKAAAIRTIEAGLRRLEAAIAADKAAQP